MSPRPSKRQPFRIDPSATAAFSALRDAIPRGFSRDAAGAIKAVVIGGGTGAPMSIRTLLSLGATTSAVVAMADDGGSTGILREEADVTPPGDIRKCIAAFARNPNDPLVKVFKYRFAVARDHALGNLLLAGLEDACGSFPEAIAICERLLDAQGHVYPSTLDHVTLVAQTRDGRLLDGQAVACHSKTALDWVALKGEEGQIRPYQPAIDAIEDADLIVLGPGSLFTSIIPNLLVPGITEAIRRSRGRVLFVCSLADVQGETWGLTALEHFQALVDHGMDGLIDYMLVHSPEPIKAETVVDDHYHVMVEEAASKQTPEPVRSVAIDYRDMLAIQSAGPVVIARNLADGNNPTWHSPQALREAFGDVIRMCRFRNRIN